MLWLLEIFQTSILLIRSVCFQPCLLLPWERIFHMKRMSGEGAQFNRQQGFNLFSSLGSLLYLRLHKRFQFASKSFLYKKWSFSGTNSLFSIFDPVLHDYISGQSQKNHFFCETCFSVAKWFWIIVIGWSWNLYYSIKLCFAASYSSGLRSGICRACWIRQSSSDVKRAK